MTLVVILSPSAGSYLDDLTRRPTWRDLAYRYGARNGVGFQYAGESGGRMVTIRHCRRLWQWGTPPITPSATMSPNMQYNGTSGGWGPIDLLPGQYHLYIRTDQQRAVEANSRADDVS